MAGDILAAVREVGRVKMSEAQINPCLSMDRKSQFLK